jgi:hypothetical protein
LALYGHFLALPICVQERWMVTVGGVVVI